MLKFSLLLGNLGRFPGLDSCCDLDILICRFLISFIFLDLLSDFLLFFFGRCVILLGAFTRRINVVVDYVRILPFGPGGCALVASVDVVVSAASVATRGRTSATEHTAYLILHHRNKFSISLSVALREVHLMSLGECFCSLETVLQLLSLNGALNLIIQSLLRRSLHSFFFLLAIFSSLLFLIPLLLRLVDTLRAIFSSRRVDVIVHGFWCLCPRGRLPLKFAVQHLLFDLSNLLILFNLFFFSYNS